VRFISYNYYVYSYREALVVCNYTQCILFLTSVLMSFSCKPLATSHAGQAWNHPRVFYGNIEITLVNF